jgi:hypothetical protein
MFAKGIKSANDITHKEKCGSDTVSELVKSLKKVAKSNRVSVHSPSFATPHSSDEQNSYDG